VIFHYIHIGANRFEIGYWDARGHWQRAKSEPHLSQEKAIARVLELNATRREDDQC
jgi:hypothetical protein